MSDSLANIALSVAGYAEKAEPKPKAEFLTPPVPLEAPVNLQDASKKFEVIA